MWCVVKPSFIAFYKEGPNGVDMSIAADVVVQFSKTFEVFRGYSTTGSTNSIKLVEDSKIVRLKVSFILFIYIVE